AEHESGSCRMRFSTASVGSDECRLFVLGRNPRRHGRDDSAGGRERLKRVEGPHACVRYLSNFSRANYFPLSIVALQLRYLHLVSGADPLTRGRVPETKSIKHQCWHASILTRQNRPRQYDRWYPGRGADTSPEPVLGRRATIACKAAGAAVGRRHVRSFLRTNP